MSLRSRVVVVTSIFITVLLGGPGWAQPLDRDKKLGTVADLTAADVAFDPRTGAVSFYLVNRGGVAVSSPFKIDISRDTLRTTIDFTSGKEMAAGLRASRNVPIQPYERRKVVIDELKVEQCSSSHSITVSIDPGQVVAEMDETNNLVQRTLVAPCPDLIVVSIGKNYNNLHTEYGAEVTIANQGTGAAGRFNVFAVTASQVTGIFTLPNTPYRTFESLGPGETAKFTVGNALAIEKMWVRVVVDAPDWNKESDENNNEMRKTLN